MKKNVLTFCVIGMLLATITACSRKEADVSKSQSSKQTSEHSLDGSNENNSSSQGEDKSSSSDALEASSYKSGEEVLNKVFDSYEEEKKFPVEGGDIENPIFDKAGMWDLAKKENIDQFLGLSSSMVEKADSIASLTNQFNANFFTGSVSHLKKGTDFDAFAKEFEAHLKGRQWICGAPDTFLVIKVDEEYILTIFGQKDFTDTFKEKALSVLNGSEVLLETHH